MTAKSISEEKIEEYFTNIFLLSFKIVKNGKEKKKKWLLEEEGWLYAFLEEFAEGGKKEKKKEEENERKKEENRKFEVELESLDISGKKKVLFQHLKDALCAITSKGNYGPRKDQVVVYDWELREKIERREWQFTLVHYASATECVKQEQKQERKRDKK